MPSSNFDAHPSIEPSAATISEDRRGLRYKARFIAHHKGALKMLVAIILSEVLLNAENGCRSIIEIIRNSDFARQQLKKRQRRIVEIAHGLIVVEIARGLIEDEIKLPR